MDFSGSKDGWNWPERLVPRFEQTPSGLILLGTSNQAVGLSADGVHTRNGDSIELRFSVLDPSPTMLTFGFQGGPERAFLMLDFHEGLFTFSTSEWTREQPLLKSSFQLKKQDVHTVLIEKEQGRGDLVKNADFTIYLDGAKLASLRNHNVLPEMGVYVAAQGGRVLLRQFVQRGVPSGIPEYFHIGGWQMPNRPEISTNLDSICRGLIHAADNGVQLLVTPETSLTGLFPEAAVSKDPRPVAEAEKRLVKFIRTLRNAPFSIVGLPVWNDGSDGGKIRLNASRLYSPDGDIIGTFAKIHSCEPGFWHGYRLNEFEVCGVPVCMHICHDGRYPETWTLPVMFGARVIVHPANPINELKSWPKEPCADLKCVTTLEAEGDTGAAGSSHTFYLHVSGSSASIASPQKTSRKSVEYNKLVSPGGETHEALCHKRIRVHDAFGYWPTRSFRASEQIARSYLALYRASGGVRGKS